MPDSDDLATSSDDASATGSAGSGLTDAHHDWLTDFTGIDTRATANAVNASSSGGANASPSAGGLVASLWQGAKSAYTAVTNAYDSVAPDPMHADRDLDKTVDAVEAAAKKGNDQLAQQYNDVPVVGTVLKATAAVSDAATDVAGGVVKGVGDLTSGVENAVVHPIDAAESLAGFGLAAAEHVPLVPGLNTAVKGAEGLVDLAEGKKDGAYGASLSQLGENLLMDTKQDPNDPRKRTDADLDFFANIGGGTKAWKDNPIDAAARTVTNLAPMVLGDDALDPAKAEAPSGGPPKPAAVNPLAETAPPAPKGGASTPAVSPLAETRPPDGPPADVDPQGRSRDPNSPETDPAQTLEQLQQNVDDARAASDAAQEANMAATQEFIRYRDLAPRPWEGFEGDPSWNPARDKWLENESVRIGQEDVNAFNRLKAAEAALDAARKAAARR